MSGGKRANASERIAAWLADHGVRQVFAVTGGGAMFLNHALASHPKLQCSFMHHEQACAMAAEGYARIAGRPAVVNVTTGPGGINALNGVFGAFTDSIPMLVISGQVKRETCLAFNPVPNLRQLGDQEAPIVEMARPVTKAAWSIGSLRELGEKLPQAWHLATTGRPGPVWLDIPIDLQMSDEEFEFIEASTESRKDVPSQRSAVDQVVKLLEEAHRPLILAGTGVRIAGAEAHLIAFVERFGIPLATAWTHDLMPSDHPLYAGRPGTIGTRAGNLCLQAADLVVVIGSRLNIRQVSYNWTSFAAGARIVQVDIDPAELTKPFVKPHVAIVADAAAFIVALQAAAARQGLPAFEPWAHWCRKIGRQFPALEAANVSEQGINPYRAVAAVFAGLPDRAVVACGNASACILPFQVGTIKAGQRMFSNSGSASMGYELPAAIGAALADQTRRVVCMAGDGSLQMNVQELQTLATLQLDVIVVVLANDGYLSIRLSHENFFGKVVGADRSSGVQCPDYVLLARAYGLRALDVRDAGQLDGLAALLAQQGPVLVQIHVDRVQGFAPKLKSRMDENGRFLTPSMDDMFPFLEAEELEEIHRSAGEIRSVAGV
ncbi:MAG: acetolactate synthase large subunit [Steroidobacteraceae bacterium]